MGIPQYGAPAGTTCNFLVKSQANCAGETARVWSISLTADLFGVAFRSYAQGVALIPKVKVSGKPAGIFAVIAAVIGLAVIPILAVAGMVLVGVAWKDGPRWTRMTLITGAVLYLAYRLGVSHPAVHH
jgi:hypothetical protein